MYLHAYNIYLPTPSENLKITTNDPFQNIEDYKPQEIVHDLANIDLFNIFSETFNKRTGD